MKKYGFFGISLVCLGWMSACQGERGTSTAMKEDSLEADQVVSALDSDTLKEAQDTVLLRLIDGKGVEKGRIKKDQHLVFSFENNKLNANLVAEVNPDSAGGNVRIAQIILPDGTADGPFGPQATYQLSQLGIYQIILSENQMAGDPYDGPFTLKVQVTP